MLSRDQQKSGQMGCFILASGVKQFISGITLAGFQRDQLAISLHHRQDHYVTETLLLKNNSIELQICTVNKKMDKYYTTIHTNWNGTLGHTSSAAFSLNMIFLDETLTCSIG